GHLAAVEPTPVDRVRDLVENHEPVGAPLDRLACQAPGVPRALLAARQVARFPAEAVAALDPVDAQAARGVLLAHLPAIRLDELDHARLPSAARHRPEQHAEGRRGLALAVARVEEHE